MTITLAAIAACKDAPPKTLGSLTTELSRWQQDCPSPLEVQAVAKGPDPMMPARRYNATAFQAASKRYVCPRPGWSLYATASDELVGFCVDDTISPRETHTARAHRVLANHFPVPFAADVTAGECSWEPGKVGHGLLRWRQYPAFVRAPDREFAYPPPANSIEACCWEVMQD